MKKTGIILTLPIVLISAWACSSWYAGKQIETKSAAQLTLINNFLASNEGKKLLMTEQPVTTSIKSYKRGILSSQIEYEANIGKFAIPLDVSIQHGPFPLSQIVKLNFTSSVVANVQLKKSELTTPLFTGNSNQSPISIDIIGDKKQVNANATVNYKDEAVNINALSLKAVIPSSAFKGNIKEFTKNKIDLYSTVKEFSFVDAEENSKVTLDTVAVRYNMKPIKDYQYLGVGDASVTINNVHLELAEQGDNKPKVKLSNVALHAKTTEEINSIGQKATFSFDELNIDGKNYGRVDMNFNLTNLDKTALNIIAQTMNKALEESKEFEYEESRVDLLVDILFDNDLIKPLLKHLPTVDFDLNWKIKESIGSYSAQVILQELNVIDPYSLFKKVESELNLPVESIKLTLDNMDDLISKEEAENIINGLGMIVAHLPYVVLDEQKIIKSSIHFEDGKDSVTVNGTEVSKDDFIELIMDNF